MKLAVLLFLLVGLCGCYKVVTVGYVGVLCVIHPIDCYRAINSESDVTPTPAALPEATP